MYFIAKPITSNLQMFHSFRGNDFDSFPIFSSIIQHYYILLFLHCNIFVFLFYLNFREKALAETGNCGIEQAMEWFEYLF